jgi:hypothetical protein
VAAPSGDGESPVAQVGNQLALKDWSRKLQLKLSMMPFIVNFIYPFYPSLWRTSKSYMVGFIGGTTARTRYRD